MTVHASGVILYRRNGACVRLLLLQNRQAGHWGFPKGRRDPADVHEVATALREVAEEVGYTGLALHPHFRFESQYTVRKADGNTYPKRVIYFLAEAPSCDPVLSDEHSQALWADEEQALNTLPYEQLKDIARAAFRAAT